MSVSLRERSEPPNEKKSDPYAEWKRCPTSGATAGAIVALPNRAKASIAAAFELAG